MTADLNEASAHNDRGRVLADQKLFDDAIEQYRKADELWQKNQSKDRKLVLCNWAEILRLQKHYGQADEKYREAISIDPDDPRTYVQLGVVLVDEARIDDAIEQYRKADELWRKNESKDRKHALYSWANALHQQKLYEQAAEKYREAIGIDPEFSDAHHGLGAVLADQDLHEQAIEQYRKADELWRKNESEDRILTLPNKADALRRQQAEKYREDIGIDPEYPDAPIGLDEGGKLAGDAFQNVPREVFEKSPQGMWTFLPLGPRKFPIGNDVPLLAALAIGCAIAVIALAVVGFHDQVVSTSKPDPATQLDRG
jgi:tetratricopeptide (TPR) repeat protein